MNRLCFYRALMMLIGLVAVGGLASLGQANTIDLGAGQSFVDYVSGNTYLFQYQVASDPLYGDGDGAVLTQTTGAGLADTVSNITNVDYGGYGYLGLTTSPGAGSGYVTYHFQATPGYTLSNISVASNFQIVGSQTAQVSWSDDGSSWNLLETAVAGSPSYDNLIPSGFTPGTDFYLKYEVSAPAGWLYLLYNYDSVGATGFKVQFDWSQPVPEPSTWAMLLIGSLVLAGYAYRRIRAKA